MILWCAARTLAALRTTVVASQWLGGLPPLFFFFFLACRPLLLFIAPCSTTGSNLVTKFYTSEVI
jgi:hypothetical protein